jgi:murein DD-endopeptidase MepM/ murein hydrolase activator NlpD
MGGSLYLAAAWTAKKINAGYYGYKRNGFWIHTLDDYKLVLAKTGLNAGTVGMQAILAVHSDTETWQKLNQPDGLMAEYKKLFGDPQKYALKGYVVPSNLTQPPLSLPWKKGKGFYLTAGPHAAYIEGSAWAGVDFGAPDVLGNCFISAEPSTAAADGLILTARPGEVELDLDGDGNIETGWVLMYLHTALDSDTPLQVGQHVKTGDVIGYASCEGGEANASHLHFVRRYNGEWLDADGPVPMELSGWRFLPTTVEYEGKVQKGKVVRDSCECWKKDENLIVNEDK